MQFQASDPNSFYDCFAFWTPKRGIVQGDGVNGKFPDLRTTDGVTWEDISNNLPPAFANEGSFAASGTCVATQGARNAWIATSDARILATRDGAKLGTPITLRLLWHWHRRCIHSGFPRFSEWHRWRRRFLGNRSSGDGNIWRCGKTWTLTNTPPVTGAISA